eukprot:TRINITY_DN54614_c0_g1_i1.p1 TRINITY_DN54614_c0_g1~~TRINITY_DN54614_c0_g1_i1.p1  ORF type:complete len:466 (+),score=45.80 TRINITY_DN54614_c0_g1_i1:106-1503(+)
MSGCTKALIFLGRSRPQFDIPQLERALSIGRVGCDIELVGAFTSRVHAELKIEDGKLQVRDKSLHGIYLNGERLQKGIWLEWQPEQVLRFGCEPQTLPIIGEQCVVDDRWDLVQFKVTASSRTKSGRCGGSLAEIAAPMRAVPEVGVKVFNEPTTLQDTRNGRTSPKEPTSVHSPTEKLRHVFGPEPPPSSIVPIRPLTVSGPSSETTTSGAQRPPQSSDPRGGSVSESAQPCQQPQKSRPVVGPARNPAPAQDPMRGIKRTHSESADKQKSIQKCDKCDGPHLTDNCPHFKKSREKHKDAWVNYGRKHPLTLGKSGGKVCIQNARLVRQPGDGSCLFHSLCFGLNRGKQANGAGHRADQLRKQLMLFIQGNAKYEIAGDTLEEWIKWDSHLSVATYTRRMAVSGWGGGIEMAACSILNKVNVHVYESRGRGFERISCFDCPEPAKRTIDVLYQGGMHFDALVLN